MIEIPREKIGAIGKDVNALVSSNNQSGNEWVKIAKTILEGLPEAKKVWDDIKGTVAQAQATPKHVPTIPTYEEAPRKKSEEVKVVDYQKKAENIFDGLVEQGEKFKMFFVNKKGGDLFETMKGKREMIVGKIAEELER